MPSNPQPAPFADLLEDNLDEATFLWTRWESELASLTRNLDEIYSWTEDRLQGAIDSLLVTGPLLNTAIDRALSSKDPTYQTLAAHLLTTAPDPNARATLATILCEREPPTLTAMIRGVEVAHLDGTFSQVTRALLRCGPQHCAALARLKSFQRATLGDELHIAYEAGTAPTKIAALRAAASLPDPAVQPWIDRGLRESDPAVRLAAIESGIRQRQRPAWEAARAVVAAGEPGSNTLLRWIAIFGNPTQDHPHIYAATADETSARQAFWALGHVGTREAAEHCLASMRNPTLGRLAGEAYVAITGADLARDQLTAPEPDDLPTLPPLEKEDLDANLIPHREDLWPVPDPDACAAHWATIQTRFAPQTRYVRGKPFTLNALMDSLARGPMLRREDHALELYIRTRGACDIEPRATYSTQRRMITHATTRLASFSSGAEP